MVAFDPSADLSGDPGYRYMHNSCVTLFWRRPLLDNAIAQLEAAGYHLVPVDASHWATPKEMHLDLARSLDFPAYYGQNLDAFNDCLRDVVARRYGWPEKATGLVLVFTGYDGFAKRHPREAQILLDIIADRARSALLFGGRLICLVQSDDPMIEFDPVGASPVIWNDAEWLTANRR
ncbi:MAG TPA: barstar family protein [Candidatus Limnocylindrales bacterium]|nr:barstar family protein [Candidatus Limnocylindrales bacterium]